MANIEPILQKRLAGERLSLEDGVALYDANLLELGQAALKLTPRLLPHAVSFVVDRNVSYTNVCVIECGFCAFYCKPKSSKKFVLSCEAILTKVEELVRLGGTQVLIQGGINPDLDLNYFLEITNAIHKKFPQIAIHSFSAIEMEMLAKKNKMSLRDILLKFKEAGLSSLPGGGAEILVERVRKIISPKKISTEKWLEVMREAHEVGFKTTATMMFGHIETKAERVEHLLRLRALQNETKGFRSFIPWSFSPRGTPALSHLSQAGGDDYLKTVAISRLMLDNFEHIQAGWLTEGLKLAQIALMFGADDMGGTLLEDKVLESTGIKILTRKEDLTRLIKNAGFIPVQRNTEYEVLSVFK